MRPFVRIALVAIAVIGVVGVGAYLLGQRGQSGDPSPTAESGVSAAPSTAPSTSASAAPSVPAARASVPPDWPAYASTRFAYSIMHPPGWSVTPATTDWTDHHPPFPSGTAVDRFRMSGDSNSYVFVTSDPLGADQSGAERIAQIDFINAGEGASTPTCLSSDRHAIMLDGVEARQEDQVCFKKDHLIEVVVVHQDRLYLVDILSPTALSPSDRTTFDQFLEGFRFGG